MSKIRFTKDEQIKFDTRITELRSRAAGLYDAMLEHDWATKVFMPRTDLVGKVYKAWMERWSAVKVPQR